MNLEEYILNYDRLDVKDMTETFNKFDVKQRKSFLDTLSEQAKKDFISDIRQQAVKDFWFHEREAIIAGKSTRDWTPEQIESIMNISELSGKMSKNAGKSFQVDEYGIVLVDKAGNKSYYGHHMLSVTEHPEYAGDWRNIQALNYDEHYKGAHNSNTRKPTKGYYDVANKKTETIDVEKYLEEVSNSKGKKDIFDLISDEYPPKHSSIFKSDAEIKAIYTQCNDLNDAEILALKNIEYSMDANGGLVDFNRGLDVARRYNSPDLGERIGIMSNDAIIDKYDYFIDMTDTDVDTFKAYEYFKSRKVDDNCIEKLGVKSNNTLLEQYKFLDESDTAIDKLRAYEYQRGKSGTEFTDTKVYFDSEGKVVGLSCYDDITTETVLELNLKDTEHYLGDTDMASKYMDYDTYSRIDQLKACQYDYECTQISEMIDNNISSRNDIELMSMEEIKEKYTFVDDTTDAEIIKELQIAEYRDKKYGTTTADNIEVYFDENGKMSCISNQGYETIQSVEIKANSKFSSTVTDVNNYRNAEYMSTICPEYENLTPIQKIQMQQLEFDARNHDIAKLQELVVNDTTGNLKDVRIIYDADGTVLGIDMSGVNGGSSIDISQRSACFDISTDGSIKARFDKPSSGTAWWQKEISTIIDNKSISSINGVPTEQFRHIKHNMALLNTSEIDGKITEAINSIQSTNVDDRALIKNINDGETSFLDRPKDNIDNPKLKINSKVYKYLDMLGTVGDCIDFVVTANEAIKCYENGDIEGAHDVIGKAAFNAAGGMLGVAVANVLITAAACSGPVGWVVLLFCGIVGGILGEEIYDTFIDGLDDEYTSASNAQPPRDPLVIDLGGLGIELTTLEDGVHFDLDKNGFAEKTAWIGSEEGFLVLDRNGDGEINDGGELFGDQVELENGLISVSGFQALAELDENKDGKIDNNDLMWSQLRVWIDKDHDGVSKGELKTLEELGIISISLNVSKEVNVDSVTGTMEAEYAMVTFKDGTQRKISEFWFPINSSDTTQSTENGESVKTIGNVPDIFIAIEQDNTGKLAGLYKKFVSSTDFVEKRYLTKEILYLLTESENIDRNSRGGNIDARDLHVIETFMGRDFQGASGANPNGNAASILEKMMVTIENMYFNYLNEDTVDGMCINTILANTDENGNTVLDFSIFKTFLENELQNGRNIDGLIYSAGAYLALYDNANGTKGYDELLTYCGEVSSYYGTIVEMSKLGNTCLGTDVADTFRGSEFNDYIFGFEGDDYISGHNGNDVLIGGKGRDTLYGHSGEDILYGEEGNDFLDGVEGDDILYGGEGNDRLHGGSGKNQIYGGKGNDILTGVYGEDTYHFEAGDGQDIIQKNQNWDPWDRNNDSIVFGESVKKEDIRAKRDNRNLILENTVTGDTITIEEAYGYADGRWTVKDIRFADGDVLTEADIKAMIRENGLHGTEGDDTIYGIQSSYNYDCNEILYGEEGNDFLDGVEGDDILYGGEGNDRLHGGSGKNQIYGGKGNDILTGVDGEDTYHFEAGDGQDVIQRNQNWGEWNRYDDSIVFGESVKKEDIVAKRNGTHLVLENKLTGDTITIEEAYGYADGRWTVKDIRFADGDVLTEADIKAMIRENGIHGGEGNDTINGIQASYNYSDDEIFYGHEGNDNLYGGLGDDTYIFEQGDGQDKIGDNNGKNTISFGEGIKAENLLITTNNWDVAINFADSEDMITLIDGMRNDAYKNFELTFMDGMIGTIDLTGETDNHINVIKEAEVLMDVAVVENSGSEASDTGQNILTDTQVAQMVDVMNTGSGENISSLNNPETVNNVEELLLFVE